MTSRNEITCDMIVVGPDNQDGKYQAGWDAIFGAKKSLSDAEKHAVFEKTKRENFEASAKLEDFHIFPGTNPNVTDEEVLAEINRAIIALRADEFGWTEERIAEFKAALDPYEED